MSNTWIIGDIHGDFKPIRATAAVTEPGDTLIQLGDFGANFFFNSRDDKFKEKLGKYDLTYFVIRGNHEQRPSLCAEAAPADWETEMFYDNVVYIEKKYPYIKYALDYPTNYLINNYKTLVFPGAYSVDKYRRLQNGWSWFPQEQLSSEEMGYGRDAAANYNNKCDLVLSHTCPIIYEPTDLFLSVVDQSTVDKTMERYLGEIERNLDYKLWCWGHYHQTRVYPEHEGKDKIMLFNDALLDLNVYFETREPESSLFYI